MTFCRLAFEIFRTGKISLFILVLPIKTDINSGKRKKIRRTVVPKNDTESDEVAPQKSYKRYLTAASAFMLEKSGKLLSYS